MPKPYPRGFRDNVVTVARQGQLAVTCRVLGISRQAYAHLINAALDIHADDPTEGYRFIADEPAQRGFIAPENRIRSMQ